MSKHRRIKLSRNNGGKVKNRAGALRHIKKRQKAESKSLMTHQGGTGCGDGISVWLWGLYARVAAGWASTTDTESPWLECYGMCAWVQDTLLGKTHLGACEHGSEISFVLMQTHLFLQWALLLGSLRCCCGIAAWFLADGDRWARLVPKSEQQRMERTGSAACTPNNNNKRM